MTTGHQTSWRTATVLDSRVVADGVRRISLDTDGGPVAEPGAHVDVRIPVGDRDVLRSYSIVATSPGQVVISVLRPERTRGGSAYLHRLEVGDTLRVSSPVQGFPLRLGASRYLLVAGGIGITAVLGMAERLAQVGADHRLVYAGRRRSAMPYLIDLADRHGDRLEVHASDEGERLDVPALISGVANDPDRDGVEAYVCGPLTLLDDFRVRWALAGLPPTNLRFETFGDGGSRTAEAFRLRVPDLGVDTQVPADESPLDALVRLGVPVMFDCLKGECGLCVAEVMELEGAIDHRDVFLSPSQKQQSRSICLCVSRIGRLVPGSTASLTLARL